MSSPPPQPHAPAATQQHHQYHQPQHQHHAPYQQHAPYQHPTSYQQHAPYQQQHAPYQQHPQTYPASQPYAPPFSYSGPYSQPPGYSAAAAPPPYSPYPAAQMSYGMPYGTDMAGDASGAGSYGGTTDRRTGHYGPPHDDYASRYHAAQQYQRSGPLPHDQYITPTAAVPPVTAPLADVVSAPSGTGSARATKHRHVHKHVVPGGTFTHSHGPSSSDDLWHEHSHDHSGEHDHSDLVDHDHDHDAGVVVDDDDDDGQVHHREHDVPASKHSKHLFSPFVASRELVATDVVEAQHVAEGVRAMVALFAQPSPKRRGVARGHSPHSGAGSLFDDSNVSVPVSPDSASTASRGRGYGSVGYAVGGTSVNSRKRAMQADCDVGDAPPDTVHVASDDGDDNEHNDGDDDGDSGDWDTGNDRVAQLGRLQSTGGGVDGGATQGEGAAPIGSVKFLKTMQRMKRWAVGDGAAPAAPLRTSMALPVLTTTTTTAAAAASTKSRAVALSDTDAIEALFSMQTSRYHM